MWYWKRNVSGIATGGYFPAGNATDPWSWPLTLH